MEKEISMLEMRICQRQGRIACHGVIRELLTHSQFMLVFIFVTLIPTIFYIFLLFFI